MTNAIKEMNIDELELVAGGTIGDSILDSEFLKAAGVMDHEVGAWDMTFHWETYSAKVDEAWKKAGIRCVSHPIWDNVYYINGRAVSRNDAIKAAAEVLGFNGSVSRYMD